MDERIGFIAEYGSGLWTMTELCERYEISRKTGYKWLDRYRLEGPAGLVERSHAALVHGRATPQYIVDAIVGLRRERPSWGPRKIIGKLEERQPDVAWPARSTAGEILKRAGLVCGRRIRRRAPPRLGQLTVPQHANHVWGIDHKGWIRLRDGARVEPLTMTDGFSRYLISVAATGSTQQAEAKPLIERAFRDYGLPEVIRSDNGSPFASTGITGLTALSVWWIKLGIQHERIDPGHPQQNGSHERFHLTLRREKGWAAGIPWLAIDEVLRIAGWMRSDVDVIAHSRGVYPTQYLRFPLLRDLYYAARRRAGREVVKRDIMLLHERTGETDSHALFRAARFLDENAFRADTRVYFANHHEAHALSALFHTDWDEALLYTADGVGDNVSYSIRALSGGRLDCHHGGENLLAVRNLRRNSIAVAYGLATAAAGFRIFRHEGKLTGLSARGEPLLADALAAQFRLGADSLVEADFKDWSALERGVNGICRGHNRETIAASIQKVAEDIISGALRHWLARTGHRRLGLAGGLFANVRLNRLLAETLPIDEIFVFPAMGDDGISTGAGLCFLMDRDGLATWLGQRRRLDDVYLGQDFDRSIDACLAAGPGICRLPGDPSDVATGLIRAGKAGAIFVGRMEYWPRALGARSIIASPADAAINDDFSSTARNSCRSPRTCWRRMPSGCSRSRT